MCGGRGGEGGDVVIEAMKYAPPVGVGVGWVGGYRRWPALSSVSFSDCSFIPQEGKSLSE